MPSTVDVKTVTNTGSTPLSIVLFNDDYVEVIDLLLANGVDVTVTSRDGCIPLEVAKQYNKKNKEVFDV